MRGAHQYQQLPLAALGAVRSSLQRIHQRRLTRVAADRDVEVENLSEKEVGV